jgi:methyl-accepting chemotaxis protein
MGESEDHPLAPILRMLDEIINESDAAAAAPITIPEAMRSIAKRLRSYTGEGDGIIERTTKSVLLFFGGIEKDALNQYASALELGAIYADLASFYIVDPVLWSELLQKWTVLAEKNEAAELAAYFQVLKQSAAQRAGGSSTTAAKMKTMQASVRHVWHNCVAFLGAETAPLANGATPTSPYHHA